MADALHLVRVPLRTDKLVAIARRRQLPVREVDEGYLAHIVLREIWGARAPAPFVLRGAGRTVDAWGYSSSSAAELSDEAAGSTGSIAASALFDVGAIESRRMPCLRKGKRLGFAVRACPVVRLSSARNGYRAGAEIDAFLACCFSRTDEPVSREETYRAWLEKTLGSTRSTGVTVARVSVTGMARERLIRRAHDPTRRVRALERPDVQFEGDLVVEDGEHLLGYLARGVGRHRAFGFGALMLARAGSASDLR